MGGGGSCAVCLGQLLEALLLLQPKYAQVRQLFGLLMLP
jgi:hypothetical protein